MGMISILEIFKSTPVKTGHFSSSVSGALNSQQTDELSAVSLKPESAFPEFVVVRDKSLLVYQGENERQT